MPVPEDDAFLDLIRRVLAGDQRAAAELVRHYEPEIRRAVRLRLGDSRLNRMLDSLDVCQSVLGRFLVGAAAGEFDLDRPDQLLRLLVRMARNKVIDHAKKKANRPVGLSDSVLAECADGRAETPSVVVGGRELLAEVRRRMTDEERLLADLRAQGRDWSEIARELNGSAEALRKKLTRAVGRVAGELGIEPVSQ
jgi:RNA polymerase sigma factor (sigma-70 family)